MKLKHGEYSMAVTIRRHENDVNSEEVSSWNEGIISSILKEVNSLSRSAIMKGDSVTIVIKPIPIIHDATANLGDLDISLN